MPLYQITKYWSLIGSFSFSGPQYFLTRALACAMHSCVSSSGPVLLILLLDAFYSWSNLGLIRDKVRSHDLSHDSDEHDLLAEWKVIN